MTEVGDVKREDSILEDEEWVNDVDKIKEVSSCVEDGEISVKVEKTEKEVKESVGKE